MNKLLLVVGLVSMVAWEPAGAAPYTVGSYSFLQETAPTSVVAAPGNELKNIMTFRSGFIPAGGGFDVNKGIGDQFIKNAPDYARRTHPRHVELGDPTNTTTLEMIKLSWSTPIISNQIGVHDLVVFENGDRFEPEGYAIAVKKVGATRFSAFHYRHASEYWPPPAGMATTTIRTFATTFDLGSMGFANGELLAEMMIMNLVSGARVVGADGQGRLLGPDGGGTGYVPTAGPLANYTYYGVNTSDPDITYVAGLYHGGLGVGALGGPLGDPAVPEPGSLALLAGGLAWLRRRRR